MHWSSWDCPLLVFFFFFSPNDQSLVGAHQINGLDEWSNEPVYSINRDPTMRECMRE